jgi:hypothetical protein
MLVEFVGDKSALFKMSCRSSNVFTLFPILVRPSLLQTHIVFSSRKSSRWQLCLMIISDVLRSKGLCEWYITKKIKITCLVSGHSLEFRTQRTFSEWKAISVLRCRGVIALAPAERPNVSDCANYASQLHLHIWIWSVLLIRNNKKISNSNCSNILQVLKLKRSRI